MEGAMVADSPAGGRQNCNNGDDDDGDDDDDEAKAEVGTEVSYTWRASRMANADGRFLESIKLSKVQ
jgi:hypothetical protein